MKKYEIGDREQMFRAWDDKEKVWMLSYEEMGGFSLSGEMVMLGEWSTVSLGKLCDIILTQYIGMKDESGKKIYEGDFVKCYREGDSKWEEIVFVEDIRQLPRLGGSSLIKREIIGNIFNNPELLK